MTLELWNIIIPVTALLVAGCVSLYAWNRMRTVAWTVWLWFALAFGFSLRGFFASPQQGFSNGDLIGFLAFGTLMFLPLVVFFIARSRLEAFREFLADIPLPYLTGFEIYRVVGIIFTSLYLQGMLPQVLGVTTGFMDVFIGVTALPLTWMLIRKHRLARQFAILWNAIGIADFALAIVVVSLSIFNILVLTPDPVMIGLHPLALISLFQLPLSIMVHFTALEKLLKQS